MCSSDPGIGGSPLAGANVGVTTSVTPNPASLGDTVVYSLSVTNAGPDPATGLILRDFLPLDVTLLAMNTSLGSITNVGSTVVATLGNLPVGAGAIVTLTLRPNAAGYFTNLATVAADQVDPVLADNVSTNVLPVISVGTFGNTASVTIADASPALTYPSVVNVLGLTGVVSKVTVTLIGLTHTFPSDLDILLVSPDGRTAVIMSDAGQGYDLTNATLVFDDAAINSLPSNAPITPGTYKPTNLNPGLATDAFPPHAPSEIGRAHV